MQRDIRDTPEWTRVEATFVRWLAPGLGRLTDAADLAVHPDGRQVAFTSTWWERLEGRPGSRIGLADVDSGHVRVLSGGPGADRLPAWSPDGHTLAFLADRHEAGVHQLWLIDEGLGEARPAAALDGAAEALAWSPDGTRLLAVVAGRGAELAGVQGSGAKPIAATELPSWIPDVDVGDEDHHRRKVWIYDVATDTARCLDTPGRNVWEAGWAGNDAIVAITSAGPSEDTWYDAVLARIDLIDGGETVLHRPPRQIGIPRSAPDGRRVAVIQALCSDRAVVAGDLVLATTDGSAEPQLVEVGFDVSHVDWRDWSRVVVAGQRGRVTVVAEVDVDRDTVDVRWESDDTCGGRVYPAAWALGDGDDVVLVREAADRPPELAVVRDGKANDVHSFAHAGTDATRSSLGAFEPVEWTAPDGQAVEGWLALPPGTGPFPMIVEVHGGPVWAWRNTWIGRLRLLPLALEHGYAYFMPNPRGSAGWGQPFIEGVYGDLGGADVDDVLSGVDAVLARYPIDATRLAVTGGSYGGYMTYVLVTRDTRFAAGMALAPVSDYYAVQWTCNIPAFVSRFLDDEPENAEGRYRSRSPLHDTARCRTPMLHAVGARDRCAPPTQGEMFHRALLQHGNVESRLVTYPEEGHGIGSFPAVFDYGARVLQWLDRHLGGAR